ncbi:DNA-binding transcriptional regulator, AcrR family [Evansella caseinilytica]|uniref:DNA-binding transcriptional regulator, AcrR family n=1 Tax=Evansella caseinilytica TaxID=1503961 RepID=A0A1H3T3Q5_9BACI|nr:TetR/AcrR family transcriptional regulator [Evansella caseinilytica]SDZ44852.1 DNA-binding transcriptional regulator, AcrR family [Evansella caseinilytica]
MKKKQVPSLVKDQRLIHLRREQIVKAAVELFHQKGFHGTTTREVAQTSGFSIGTLYEYIGSKEDILYLVCDAVYEEIVEKWERLVDENLHGINRLYQIIDAYFRVVHVMQNEVLVMYQESKSLSDDALNYVLQKELSIKSIFEKELRACRDAGLIRLNEEEISLACHNILVAGHMWTFRRWIVQKEYDIDAYCRWQIQQLFRGMNMKAEAAFSNLPT